MAVDGDVIRGIGEHEVDGSAAKQLRVTGRIPGIPAQQTMLAQDP
jgi:hypothetical protein